MVRRAQPVRTCVGCRQRAPASELLRVIAVGEGAGQAVDGRIRVMPDPTRRLPGRGAHIHPDPACFALAERRRAFGRALRITGVLDTGPLAEYLGGDLHRRSSQGSVDRLNLAPSGAGEAQPAIPLGTADGGGREPPPGQAR